MTNKGYTTMKATSQVLKVFLDYLAMFSDDVRTVYVSRGSYKACIGFVSDEPMKTFGNVALEAQHHAGDLPSEIADEFIQIVSYAVDSVKMDTMGDKTIVYFPGLFLG